LIYNIKLISLYTLEVIIFYINISGDYPLLLRQHYLEMTLRLTMLWSMMLQLTMLWSMMLQLTMLWSVTHRLLFILRSLILISVILTLMILTLMSQKLEILILMTLLHGVYV